MPGHSRQTLWHAVMFTHDYLMHLASKLVAPLGYGNSMNALQQHLHCDDMIS